MKKSIDLWYAVSKTGRGAVFTECPVRNDVFGVWEGRIVTPIVEVVRLFESDGFALPEMKWPDDPVKLVLSLDS